MQCSGRSAHDHAFSNWLGSLWMDKVSFLAHIKLTPRKTANDFIHAGNLQHQRPTRLFKAELGIVRLLKSIQHHCETELPQILPSLFHYLKSSIDILGTIEKTPHAPRCTHRTVPEMLWCVTNQDFKEFLSMAALLQITLRQSKTLCTTAKTIDLFRQNTVVGTHDL